MTATTQRLWWMSRGSKCICSRSSLPLAATFVPSRNLLNCHPNQQISVILLSQSVFNVIGQKLQYGITNVFSCKGSLRVVRPCPFEDGRLGGRSGPPPPTLMWTSFGSQVPALTSLKPEGSRKQRDIPKLSLLYSVWRAVQVPLPPRTPCGTLWFVDNFNMMLLPLWWLEVSNRKPQMSKLSARGFCRTRS